MTDAAQVQQRHTEQVHGRCPRGCGETLFLGSGGYVTCSWHRCPDPAAANRLLAGDQARPLDEVLRTAICRELLDHEHWHWLDAMDATEREDHYRFTAEGLFAGDDSFQTGLHAGITLALTEAGKRAP